MKRENTPSPSRGFCCLQQQPWVHARCRLLNEKQSSASPVRSLRFDNPFSALRSPHLWWRRYAALTKTPEREQHALAFRVACRSNWNVVCGMPFARAHESSLAALRDFPKQCQRHSSCKVASCGQLCCILSAVALLRVGAGVTCVLVQGYL